MIVMLLTEHHLEFLSLKGGCTGSSESKHVKMFYCRKSHATAQLFFNSHSYLEVCVVCTHQVFQKTRFHGH